jgi:hypothetical protein
MWLDVRLQKSSYCVRVKKERKQRKKRERQNVETKVTRRGKKCKDVKGE